MSDPAPEEFVKVLSSDGFVFIVKREVAVASGTLERSLDPEAQFMESTSLTCEIPHRGIIVAKVLEYLSFKVQYKDATAKDYVPDFADRIEPEIALEVLMAADYLEA